MRNQKRQTLNEGKVRGKNGLKEKKRCILHTTEIEGGKRGGREFQKTFSALKEQPI